MKVQPFWDSQAGWQRVVIPLVLGDVFVNLQRCEMSAGLKTPGRACPSLRLLTRTNLALGCLAVSQTKDEVKVSGLITLVRLPG